MALLISKNALTFTKFPPVAEVEDEKVITSGILKVWERGQRDTARNQSEACTIMLPALNSWPHTAKIRKDVKTKVMANIIFQRGG